MARLEESRSSFMGHDFLSNPESFINESLLSTALANQDVAVLDKLNAVIRRDHKEALHEKVKILGGCSSGHEPAFASYVGEGMLTAAVQVIEPPQYISRTLGNEKPNVKRRCHYLYVLFGAGALLCGTYILIS